MAEKELSTISNQDEKVSSAIFSHQCFLLHNYEQFIRNNEQTTYKNFVILNGEPNLLMSKILGTGIEPFFQIKPHLLSLLQPKVRIFLSQVINNEEKDIELIFNDYYRDENPDIILKNSGQRGFGVGLKSFSWEDTGTHPGDTGKAFAATIVLYAQSLLDLFGEQVDNETKKVISFADLIRVPSSVINKTGEYNDKNFRIKAQVGWQIPNESISLFSKELIEAIKHSSITLFLTLINHEINLNKDGSAQVTANYVGAIEGKMLSPETDILYIDKEHRKFLQIQEKLVKYYNDREQKLQQNIETSGKKDERSWWQKSVDFIKNGFDSRSNDELELSNIDEEKKGQTKIKENLQKENKIISYKRFLTALENKNRIFYTDLDQNDIDAFLSLKNDIYDTENIDPSRLEQVKAQRIQETRLKDKEVFIFQGGIEPDNPFGKTNIDETLKSLFNNNTFDEVAGDALNKRLVEASKPKENGKTRINFIYFGDILDTALNIIQGDEENDKNVSDKIQLQRKDIKENFRFLLGPIELYDPYRQETQIVNLADIPISIDLFNAWFLKKVIRPQLTRYLLRDFLRDICSELVVKAVSPDCLGPYAQASTNRISFSIFSLGSDDNIDVFKLNNKFGNTRININDLDHNRKTLMATLRSTSVQKTKQYFMIYVSSYKIHSLNKNYQEDTDKGIYHLFFGADTGIVKNITFKKTDLQYFKEARIINSIKTQSGDVFFAEPYNARIELYGNPTFKPGMMLYIDPRSISNPVSVPKNKRIPIGGYYVIIKTENHIDTTKYETILDVNYMEDGEESNKKQYNTLFKPLTQEQKQQIDDIRRY